MAKEERKKEFVQVDEADFQTIVDDLNQIQGVVSLAQSVAEEHAAGEPPWCYIEHGLKFAQHRIEELIIAICDILEAAHTKPSKNKNEGD